ncbi:TPA: Fe-S cluster assembly protein SufD [Serratia marcescens]|uniref:Fe-S cluster assembly protein SufD n=1 Tax=Serratia TaxID=613 RepID=UPI0006695572|nr:MULTISPECIES: Fe-S cluster assembly protein SufD [Serratia]AVE48683.1 signal peptide peptidase SppA [Serratia marcescens]MBH2709950.1 Fe-S cluster assembly protein SufD [Serratia marcescens]MBH2853231.1 Fe-S cluster assembly protein SufD [Serratia marcescens]MBH2972041.1 Fe-S cluster assembly protein SufD [Serratia marcescens]MBN3985423.1 Fe-S cluster assembly protein SufD [Serratia marcescens]
MAGLPTNSNSNALQQLYRLFEGRGGERSPHALAHWQQALRLGWPTRKHENWKYTPLESLLEQQFLEPQPAPVSAEQLEALALGIDACRLVFIDGRYSAALSDGDLGDYQFELTAYGTPQALPEPIQPEIFLHLTESLAQETSLIRLPAGKAPARPLYLLHISSGRGATGEVNTVHHRHHLEIGRGAEAEVIEHYVSLGEAAHFTGARLTANVADNAGLLHCKLAFESQPSYHFAHNDLVIGRDARVKSDSFLLGAGLTRHNTSAQLNGEGANLVINSLVLPVGKEICDTRTYLEHNKGYCESRQLHKTVVSDRGKAVFNGMIKVAKHAIKTDGQMTNHNLLLGKVAEVDTKPQLEIYADDVKCSHGATVGRIDEEQLFYLQSRGIDKHAAQQMIIFAFAAELTEGIANDTIRERVLARIAQRLPGEAE